jgi:hypothetical protein
MGRDRLPRRLLKSKGGKLYRVAISTATMLKIEHREPAVIPVRSH